METVDSGNKEQNGLDSEAEIDSDLPAAVDTTQEETGDEPMDTGDQKESTASVVSELNLAENFGVTQVQAAEKEAEEAESRDVEVLEEVKCSEVILAVEDVTQKLETDLRPEDVEAAALDFVVNNLHHPVVSCYRELTKRDVHQIFNQVRFKTDCTEVEQAIMCITLMDYIATSVNNPLYADNFSKSNCSVRPCVKVIFTETRRVLKEWLSSSPSTFLSGKRMVIKYLQELSMYFKEIQYEKTYLTAVNCLEKDVARAHRLASKSTLKVSKEPKSVLNEVLQNMPESEVKEEEGLGESFFDFLDDVPSKLKTPAASVPMNKTPASKPKEKSKSNLHSFFKPPKKPSKPRFDIESSSPSLKRASSTKLDENSSKKLCISDSPTNVSEEKKADKISACSKQPTLSKFFTPVNTAPKEKVNAFVLLMNRSKELAKANKAKKQTQATGVSTTPKQVFTVE